MPTFREDLHLGHAVPTVDTDDITAKAITEDKMADDSISTRCLQDGSVTEPKLADGAVSTRTIQDGAVTAEKLADGAVTKEALSDEVYEIMQSVKEGGVALAQDWGGHTALGISQNKLTEEHNRVNKELQAINDAIGEDDGEGTVRGRIKAIEDEIGTGEEGSGTIKDRISSLETAVEAEDGSVNSRINAVHEELSDGLQDEIDRATNIEGGLRNDVNDINDTLTQDLGFAPAGVNKSAHERITDLVEEGIRTVELGQAALDETPVQGHDTTVVTSDGLFNKFADITKELEPVLDDGANSVIANDKRTLNSFIINTTSSTITEVQTENNKIVLYNRPFNKGTIIHFEGSYTNNAAVLCFAFSRNNIYAYDDSAIADVPVDVVYSKNAASHNTDVVVPYDNAYCIFAYYYNNSGNKLSTTSRVIYPAGALKESIANLNKNMYQIVLSGTGNAMAGSIVRSVTFGHTYRLHLKDPNISMAGISYSTSGYNKLLVNEKVNGNNDRHPNQPLVKVTMDKALEEYYDFTIPELSTEEENDGYTAQTFYITINMRAAFGAAQTFIIEDITETTKLKKDVDEIGLREDITVFPDLAIGDEEGNDIVRFEEGHVKTKNFDSRDLAVLPSKVDAIEDEIQIQTERIKDFIAEESFTSINTSKASSTISRVLFTSTSPVIQEASTDNYKVKYLLKQYKKNTIIHFHWVTSNSTLMFSYGFSPQNPAEYMEEHDASLIGFEVEGIQDRYSEEQDGSYVFDFDAVMPYNGWLLMRFWSNGSSWSESSFCTYEQNGKVGEVYTDDSVLYDYAVADEKANVILGVKDGHIKTKNFDSSVGIVNYRAYQQETKYTYNVEGSMPYDPYVAGTDIFTVVANREAITTPSKVYSDRAALYLPTSYTSTGTPTRLVIFGRQGNGVFTANNNFAKYDIEAENDDNYLRIVPYLLSLGYAVLAIDGCPDGWISEMLSPATLKDGSRSMEGNVNGSYMAVRSARVAYDLVVNDYNIAKDGVFGYGYSQGGWMIMNIAELSGIHFLGVVLKSPVITYSTYIDRAAGYVVSPGGIEYPAYRYFTIRMYYGINPAAEEMPLEDFMAIPTEPMRWGGYDHFTRFALNVPSVEDINKIDSDEAFDSSHSYKQLPLSTQLTKFNMVRFCRFPIKIWIAKDDGTVGYKRHCIFVKALQNAGCFGDIRLYQNGYHWMEPEFFDVMGTFEYNGRTYNLYPPTYEMAVFFSRFGGIVPTYNEV